MHVIKVAGMVLASVAPVAAGAQTRAADRPPMAGFALANIALSTDRPQELARWYEKVLGFREASRSPGVEGVETLIIERGGVRIDLIRVPAQRPRESPIDPPRHLEVQGLRNLVFWVDDLADANRHLRTQGVKPVWESLFVPGIRTSITAFRDPDGNLVALWQRRR